MDITIRVSGTFPCECVFREFRWISVPRINETGIVECPVCGATMTLQELIQWGVTRDPSLYEQVHRQNQIAMAVGLIGFVLGAIYAVLRQGRDS